MGQPYKFGGKELLTANGLNEYDFGARRYFQAVPHFTSVDPLCEKIQHLSPYLYCGNDPVNLVDRNGKEPSKYEAALMSGCAYNDDEYNTYYEKLLQTKWSISEKTTSITMNKTGFGENGLQSMLFERTIDGETEYAYAFAGTNSFEDILEDFGQIVGTAPQYSLAIENAKTLSEEIGNAELTFVGHSLGGGEAAAASMATNRKAITFNRASVSKLTQLFHNLGSPRNIRNIIVKSQDSSGNYVMEPLSRVQNINILGAVIMPSKGITEFLRIDRQLGLSEAHSIKTIINYIR